MYTTTDSAEPPGRLRIMTLSLSTCTISTARLAVATQRLGGHRPQVVRHSLDVVGAYSERPDGTIRSPTRHSEALLTVGVVVARRGELDTTVANGLAGLDDPHKSAPSLLST